MSVFQLTNFQRDLLFVVAGTAAVSGKEVKQTLEESQDRRFLAGRVYTNLDALVEEEFVEKGEIDGRTNQYKITDAGEEAIRDLYEWQQRHVAEPMTVDT